MEKRDLQYRVTSSACDSLRVVGGVLGRGFLPGGFTLGPSANVRYDDYPAVPDQTGMELLSAGCWGSWGC